MQPKKHYFAHIPTIAIFIVFAMSAPLGVLLFILKSIDKTPKKRKRLLRRRRQTIVPTSAPPLRRRHPGRKPSQLTATMFPPKSRRTLRSVTNSLPPCAPSAVLSFCSRASALCSWMALTA